MIHAQVDEAQHERLVLWTLGLLEPADAAATAAHVAACDACAAEAAALRAVTDDLALAAMPRSPSPELRDRLRDAVRADRRDYRFTLAGDDGWREVAPGILCRELGEDPASGSRSYLIRMAPGARGGRHVHAAAEHCLVLEGDFTVAGRTLRPGDYHLATPGSVHDGNTTAGGCLLLLVEAAPRSA